MISISEKLAHKTIRLLMFQAILLLIIICVSSFLFSSIEVSYSTIGDETQNNYRIVISLYYLVALLSAFIFAQFVALRYSKIILMTSLVTLVTHK